MQTEGHLLSIYPGLLRPNLGDQLISFSSKYEDKKETGFCICIVNIVFEKFSYYVTVFCLKIYYHYHDF